MSQQDHSRQFRYRPVSCCRPPFATLHDMIVATSGTGVLFGSEHVIAWRKEKFFFTRTSSDPQHAPAAVYQQLSWEHRVFLGRCRAANLSATRCVLVFLIENLVRSKLGIPNCLLKMRCKLTNAGRKIDFEQPQVPVVNCGEYTTREAF